MSPTNPLSVPSNHDIVTILRVDHARLVADLRGAAGSGPGQRVDRFWAAAYELARHEGSEDQVVRGALQAADRGSSDVDPLLERWATLQERQEADLRDLEHTIEQPTFEIALGHFAERVGEHAEWEERELLPLLTDGLTESQRFEWGDRYTQAKKTAPSHPHPGLEPATRHGYLLSLLLAFVDRLRDLVRLDRPPVNRSASPRPRGRV